MKYKIIILLLSHFFLINPGIHSQVYKKTRTITKVYKLKTDCQLQITNKYGNIHITPWNKDTVKLKVEVIAKSKKRDKIEEILNSINIDFTNTSYYIIATTNFSSSKPTFVEDFMNVTNTLFGASNKVEINYTVFMPSTSSLKIDNKFGNIYTTDHNAPVDIKLSNGDFKAHDLNDETKIELEFGTGMVNLVKNARLKLNYVDNFELVNSEKVYLESRSSTLNIGEAKELDINSKRDKLFINSVELLKGSSSFSYITVFKFYKDIILTTKYGNVRLDNIPNNFSNIKINSSYTDFNLYFSKDASYQLDIEHNDKTSISFPFSYPKLDKELINESSQTYKTQGNIGSGSTKSKVQLNLQAGKISIVHR